MLGDILFYLGSSFGGSRAFLSGRAGAGSASCSQSTKHGRQVGNEVPTPQNQHQFCVQGDQDPGREFRRKGEECVVIEFLKIKGGAADQPQEKKKLVWIQGARAAGGNGM